jgi:hypothetical protein
MPATRGTILHYRRTWRDVSHNALAISRTEQVAIQ